MQKIKGEIKESHESLLAAEMKANETEAKLELLVTTKDALIVNFTEMKVIEALLMRQLGFL